MHTGFFSEKIPCLEKVFSTLENFFSRHEKSFSRHGKNFSRRGIFFENNGVTFLFDYEWCAIDFLYQTILEIRAILLGSSYGATEACLLGYENERL